MEELGQCVRDLRSLGGPKLDLQPLREPCLQRATSLLPSARPNTCAMESSAEVWPPFVG